MRQKDCFNTLVTHPSLLFFVILSFKAVKESMNKANHPHAVTAIYDKGTPVPSESQMDYDANGNMIRKGNKIFVYDALNRLRTIKDGTKILEQFIYDYQGQRVITKREDNVVTVNIDGLYEINTVPGKEETKTKYIYGIKNEVVTQITDNNSTFLTWYDKGVLEKYYDKDSVSGLLMYGYGYATRIVSSPEYNRAIVKSGVIALILLFGIMTVWVAVKNPKTTQLTRIPTFLKPTVPVLMLAFSVLTMQGCYMFENETVSGTPPWLAYEDAPNNSPQNAEQSQNSDGNGTGSSAEPTMIEQLSEYLFGKPEGSGIITSGIPKTGVLFFHPDYTGNTKFVTDSYGNVRSTMKYKPYGEVFNQTGTDNFRHKFNGKEKDHYTGLYYYGARYYDPEIGRWTSPDPTIPEPGNTQAFNRYSFVCGSPIAFQDEGGYSKRKGYFECIGEKCLAALKDTGREIKTDFLRTEKYLNRAEENFREGGVKNVLQGIGWVIAGVVAYVAMPFLIILDCSIFLVMKQFMAVLDGYEEGEFYQNADEDMLDEMEYVKKNPGSKNKRFLEDKSTDRKRWAGFNKDFARLVGVLTMCITVSVILCSVGAAVLAIPFILIAAVIVLRLLGKGTLELSLETRYGGFHYKKEKGDKGDSVHYEERDSYYDFWDHLREGEK